MEKQKILKMKKRPPRVYVTKSGRFYILKNGKKVYIQIPKTEKPISQKQLQKQVVNVVLTHPRYYIPIKKRKRTFSKTGKVYFQKPFVKGLIGSRFGYANTQKNIIGKEIAPGIYEPHTLPNYTPRPTLALNTRSRADVAIQNTPLTIDETTQVSGEQRPVNIGIQVETEPPLIPEIPTPSIKQLESAMKKLNITEREMSPELNKDFEKLRESIKKLPPLSSTKPGRKALAIIEKTPNLRKNVKKDLSSEYKKIMNYDLRETPSSLPVKRRVTYETPITEPIPEIKEEIETDSPVIRRGSTAFRRPMITTPESPPLEMRDVNAIDEALNENELMSKYGKGKYSNWHKGLYDTEIHKIMEHKAKRFVPVIMSDEIPTLLPYINKNTKEFGFIINSTSSKTSGQHWRAVFIDVPNSEIDYYDSLVSQPTKEFLQDIKLLVDKINPDTYMKLKINMIKQQGDDSENCGFFACRFIIDKFKNKPFKNACGCDKSDMGEYEIEKFKNYL